MNETFLSRREHDMVLDVDSDLLRRMFSECARRRWSLGGVTFYGLKDDLLQRLQVLRQNDKSASLA